MKRETSYIKFYYSETNYQRILKKERKTRCVVEYLNMTNLDYIYLRITLH